MIERTRSRQHGGNCGGTKGAVKRAQRGVAPRSFPHPNSRRCAGNRTHPQNASSSDGRRVSRNGTEICGGSRQDKLQSIVTMARRSKQGLVVGSKLSDFEFIGQLGAGAHGVVHKVRSKLDGKVYVIKEVRLRQLKTKDRKAALAEVQVLQSIDHPNIIRYYCSFLAKEQLYIVFEFAGGGDLHAMIASQRQKRFYLKESQLWRYLWELSEAIGYLHKKRIIHRDIKSLNVFLTAGNRIKLGDLGVSRIVGEADLLRTRVGTPLYLPPELIKRQPYDFKADIWSLGCLLYSLAKLQPPFSGNNIYALGLAIVQAQPKPLPQCYTHRFRQTVMSMLRKSPEKRPSIKEICTMVPLAFKTTEIRKESGTVYVSDHATASPRLSIGSSKVLEKKVSQNKSNDAREHDRFLWKGHHDVCVNSQQAGDVPLESGKLAQKRCHIQTQQTKRPHSAQFPRSSAVQTQRKYFLKRNESRRQHAVSKGLTLLHSRPSGLRSSKTDGMGSLHIESVSSIPSSIHGPSVATIRVHQFAPRHAEISSAQPMESIESTVKLTIPDRKAQVGVTAKWRGSTAVRTRDVGMGDPTLSTRGGTSTRLSAMRHERGTFAERGALVPRAGEGEYLARKAVGRTAANLGDADYIASSGAQDTAMSRSRTDAEMRLPPSLKTRGDADSTLKRVNHQDTFAKNARKQRPSSAPLRRRRPTMRELRAVLGGKQRPSMRDLQSLLGNKRT